MDGPAAEGLDSRGRTTTVVIPAYRSTATLERVLTALAPQVRGPHRDVVVVDSSCDGSAERVQQRFPWATVVGLPARAAPGRARNHAVARSDAELIAFLDADAVPADDWLDELEAGLTAPLDAVAGAVLNGTPHNAVGTAGYLLEFAEWLPGRRSPLLHGATCNLLVRRDVLTRAGGFDETAFPGEDTVLTYPLACDRRLGFAPAAAVTHLNRTSARAFLAHQFRLGGGFGLVCARVDFPHRTLGRRPYAPLAGVLRVAALTRRLVLDDAAALRRAVAISPLLAVGIVAWAAGVARGPRPVGR